jgi:hypothetical protein
LCRPLSTRHIASSLSQNFSTYCFNRWPDAIKNVSMMADFYEIFPCCRCVLTDQAAACAVLPDSKGKAPSAFKSEGIRPATTHPKPRTIEAVWGNVCKHRHPARLRPVYGPQGVGVASRELYQPTNTASWAEVSSCGSCDRFGQLTQRCSQPTRAKHDLGNVGGLWNWCGEWFQWRGKP